MKLYSLKTFLGELKVLMVECKYQIDKNFLFEKLDKLNLSSEDVVLLIECFSFLKDEIRKRYPSQVLIIGGCTPKELLKKFKKKVLVATGNFYLAYYSGFPETLLVDPITKQVTDLSRLSVRWKSRKVELSRFRNRYVAIVASLKSGQHFPIEFLEDLKLRLKQKARTKSVDIVIFRDNVTEEALYNLGYDAYILTSCPRVLDDFDDSLKQRVYHITELMLE